MKTIKNVISLMGLFLALNSLSAQDLVPFQLEGNSEKWGYKDLGTGKVIIYWHFEEADSFRNDGLARVMFNSQYGLINKAGQIVIPIRYQYLPKGFRRDTLYTSIYNKRAYYVRQNDNIYKFKKGSIITDEEPFFSKNTLYELRVFKYPEDSLLVKQLQNSKKYRSRYNSPQLEETVYQPKASIGISAIVSNTTKQTINPQYFPSAGYALSFEHYFNTSNKGRHSSYIGLGSTLRATNYYGDSFSYKSLYFSLDIIHRLYLGKDFHFIMGLSPILGNNSHYKSRIPGKDPSWQENTFNQGKFKANFSLGFGFSLTRGTELQFNYIFIPSPANNNKIQSSFLECGFKIKL